HGRKTVISRRSWSQARASIVAAVLAVWFLLPSSPPPGYGYDRPAEFLIAARVYARRGEVDRALRELDLSMRLARDEPAYRSSLTVLLYEKGTIQAAAGRYLEAADSFRAVLRRDPGYSEAAEALRNLPGSHPEEP
ncbi:MAG: tetratricopeptide repeat protein, partial [Acidobacteriota bacterium]